MLIRYCYDRHVMPNEHEAAHLSGSSKSNFIFYIIDWGHFYEFLFQSHRISQWYRLNVHWIQMTPSTSENPSSHPTAKNIPSERKRISLHPSINKLCIRGNFTPESTSPTSRLVVLPNADEHSRNTASCLVRTENWWSIISISVN